jgi:hypothetical protein
MQFFYANKDVTNIMDKHFLNQENKSTYYIPKNTNYNQFFSDPAPNTHKALEIYDEKQNTRILISENTSPLEITIQSPKPTTIHIIYFINIYVRPNYSAIYQGQMHSLINTKILNHPNTKLYIVASGPIGSRSQFTKETIKLLAGYNINIDYNYQNHFEFPGIMKVWEIAQQYQSDNNITLYFHSKGIMRSHERTKIEIQCFKTVIDNWKHALYIFNTFPLINKIGCASSKEGWCWYNFWFARNTYLQHVEEPIISENRYYYEDWLARSCKHTNPLPPRGHEITSQYNLTNLPDCFQLLTNPKQHFYHIGTPTHPHEANDLLDKVQI